jgi:hypothetical protein
LFFVFLFFFFKLGNPSPSRVDTSSIYICNMSLYSDKVEYKELIAAFDAGVLSLVLRHKTTSQQQLETSYVLDCNIIEEANYSST